MSAELTFTKKSGRIWPILTLIFALISIGLLIALIVVLVEQDDDNNKAETAKNGGNAAVCGSTNPNGHSIDLREPDMPGPFHDLTVDELRKLRTFLEKDSNIRAAKSSSAGMNSSYIFMADLFLPRKADVLNFLNNASAAQPSRRARVIMQRGDLSPPQVEEYICSPLPNVEKCELMNYANRRNPVEFSLRPMSELEFGSISQSVLKEVDRQVGYILRESFGATFTECSLPEDCFSFMTPPMGTALLGDINQRRMWMWATYNLPYYMLHPVDFGVLCNLDGSDITKWSVDRVWYAGRLYDTMDDLIRGYNSSSIPRANATKPVNSEELYSTLYRRGDPMPPNPQRPPTLVEPDGKRYSVKGRKVEYMGWTFNFRMSPLTGPAIYDIRYKGERIAYEISLEEVSVFYSGKSPLPQTTDYVDSGALIGWWAKTMVPGADCPETAVLINQTFLAKLKEEPDVYDATFCLFENNNGSPLRRHSSWANSEGGFYGGMLDSALTLRSGLTIANYDYVVDFIFHQNGAIETRFISTGYIQTNVYSDAEKPYGFRIHDRITGNMHFHLSHFKVDLDIGGTSNSYQTLDISTEAAPITAEPTKTYYQSKFARNLKTTEKEAVYDFNFNTPKYHLVHNNATRNKYGEMKAYRIQMNGMSKFLLPEDEGNEPSITWARHQLVVTKHKDEEFLSGSNYGMFDSLNPVINFTSFYEDDDSIVDQDLVFWITNGMYHIPHTEDLPVTPAVGNHLTFFLLPYNYYPECPSMSSRDSMYITHKDPKDLTKGVTVERYGNTGGQCQIPEPALEEELVKSPSLVVES